MTNLKITGDNIRALFRVAGFAVDGKTDTEVIEMISDHLREFAAMKDAVRLVLSFAKRYGHEA